MREQQKEHGKPEQDSYHVGATVDQSNPGGLGQPRGQAASSCRVTRHHRRAVVSVGGTR